MQSALLMVRDVGARSLAASALVLMLLVANDSFAAGDTAQDSAGNGVIARPAAASEGGSVSAMVLPLDHGPRATTTPWLNQQRRLKAAAAASAARQAASVGPATVQSAQH